MKSLTIKELRTALKVLELIGTDVPNALFVAISDKIREREEHLHDHRMRHLTEEQLIRLDGKTAHRLRITTHDGRIVQGKSNEETFLSAIRLVPEQQLKVVQYKIRSRYLIHVDKTEQRKRITGYSLLCPGIFVCKGTTMKEKVAALQYLDETFQLGWSIESL